MSRRSWALMGATAAIWGASYMLTKLALDDLSAGAIVFLRTALGAGVLLWLAQRSAALGTLRGRLRWIAVIAATQVVAPFLLLAFSLHHIDSQLTGIIVSAAPIFVALLALRFDAEERPRGIGAVGVAVGMLGVVALFGLDLSGDVDTLVGGIMVLLAALSYGAAWLLIKHKTPDVAPVGLAAATMSMGALATLPFLVATPPDHLPDVTTVGAMLLLGVGGTGFAFLWFYTMMADIGPSKASVVSYIAPGFSVVYGTSLLDEPVTVPRIAGLTLILAGSWLAVQSRAPAWLSRSGPCRSNAPAPGRVR